MPHIRNPTITNFAATADKPAYLSLGGLTTKTHPDGSSVEIRIEPVTMGPDAFLRAASRLLRPQLGAVLAQGDAALAAFQDEVRAAAKAAEQAHVKLRREMARIFAAASGQAVNHTLPNSTLSTPALLGIASADAATAPDGTPVEVVRSA